MFSLKDSAVVMHQIYNILEVMLHSNDIWMVGKHLLFFTHATKLDTFLFGWDKHTH